MVQPIARFREFLRNPSFARSVAVLSGGTAIAQILTICAAPILTRLFSPEEFGAVAVFSTVLGLLTVASSLRYEMAITLPESDLDSANLVVLCLCLNTVFGLLAIFAVMLGSNWFIDFTRSTSLIPYVWLLPIAVLGVSYYQTLSYWAVRNQSYWAIANTRVYQAIAMLLVQIGGGLLSFGIIALLSAQIVGQSTGISSLVKHTVVGQLTLFKQVTSNGIVSIAKRYARFPKFSSGSALVNVGGQLIPTLILSSYFGLEVAGMYALCHRLAAIPSQVIGRSVAQVFIGEAPRLARESPAQFHSLLLRSAKKLFLIGSLPIIVLTLVGSTTFDLAFGEEWAAAGIFLALMGPSYGLNFIVSPLSGTLDILERQDIALYWDVARLISVVLSIIVPGSLGYSDIVAVASLSLASSLLYCVLFFFCYRISLQNIEPTPF